MEKFEIDLGYTITGRDAKTGNRVTFSSHGQYWSEGGVTMDMNRPWNGAFKTAADAIEALEKAQQRSDTRPHGKRVTNIGIRRIKLTVSARPVTEDDIATAQIQKAAFEVLDKQTLKDMTNEKTRQFMSTAARAMLDLKSEFASSAKGSSKYIGSITLLKGDKEMLAIKTGYGDKPLETLDAVDALRNAPESVVNRTTSDLGRQFIDRAFTNAEQAGQANGLDKVLVGTVYAKTTGKALSTDELLKLVREESRDANLQAQRYARIQRSLKP